MDSPSRIPAPSPVRRRAPPEEGLPQSRIPRPLPRGLVEERMRVRLVSSDVAASARLFECLGFVADEALSGSGRTVLRRGRSVLVELAASAGRGEEKKTRTGLVLSAKHAETCAARMVLAGWRAVAGEEATFDSPHDTARVAIEPDQ